MRYVIIDFRMRECEKKFLRSMGLGLMEIQKSKNVYEEISAHVDIFTCKIDNNLIIEKSRYNYFKEKIVNSKINLIERGFIYRL